MPEEVKKELAFLQDNKFFLEEFYQIQSQSLALQKLLKQGGYSEEVLKILNKSEQKSYKISPRIGQKLGEK